MKKMLIVYFSLLLFHINASAQETIIVNGKITEAGTGIPIPSANVIEKGTSNGVMTDFDGEFKINVPENAVLIISYVGFATSEIEVNRQTQLTIVLNREASALDEVILTGYTSQRRTELSSSVSVVSGENLNDVTSNDVATLLQGKASGVIVSSSSGDPNAKANITIRGSSSITAGSEPLYVVDGIIGGDANPNDIESITVLKDAAATGLYGSRAANGVIIITTKRGNAGKTQIHINSTMGFNTVDEGNYEIMNSQQLYDYQKTFWNPETWDRDRPSSLLSQDTDWQGLGYRTGVTQNHTIDVSGGSEKTQVYVSGNYYYEEGTLRHTGNEAYNLRSNISHQINDKLKLSVRLNARTRETENDASGNYAALVGIYTYTPWDNPYNPDGSIKIGNEEGWIGRDNDNFLHGWQYNFDLAKQSSIYADVILDYNIAEGLSFSTHNRASSTNEKRELYYDIRSKAGIGQGRLTNSFFRNTQYLTSNRLNYQTSFDNHHISTIVVAEAERNYSDFTSVIGGGFAPGLHVMDAASTILEASSSTGENIFSKGLAQIDYNYDNRYFLIGSFIRESSSRFGANNRAANFYTLGGSWIIKKNQEVFDLLKLRASYGKTGNAQISNYQTLGLYSFATQYAGNSGSFPSQMANENLAWEKAKTTNFGLDIGFFKRISLNVDLYQKSTSDLLLEVQLPYTSGFSSVLRNVGSVRNRGLELNLNTVNLNGALHWETNFNIAFNKNKVMALDHGKDILGNEAFGPTRIIRVGEDLNSWYMRKWAGVDPENGDPLWESITTNANGEEIMSTTNNYNDATLQIAGSFTPKFTGGINNVFTYKAFSLSAFFNFVSGVDIYGTGPNDGAYQNRNEQILPKGETRWQQPGDIATHPRPVAGGNLNSNKVSSRYLQDGSYIRMRNARFSYKLPSDLLTRVNITNASVFISGDNLWTFTSFNGRDPQASLGGFGSSEDALRNGRDPQASLGRIGGEVGKYPISRKILFGVNITL